MDKEIQIPEYVIQPNVISQAIYSVGVNARRMMAMAMALLPHEPKTDKDYTVSFTVTDFMKAVGLGRGSETKKYIKAAVEECLQSAIKINMPNGDWVGYTWFTESRLSNFKFEWQWGWDKITMSFNPKLGQAIAAFKKAFAKVDLLDLGKLQSRYSQRFYELALSYAGFAGKEGNPRNEWYFERTIEDIRTLFEIDSKKYKVKKDFRIYVIDKPIEEINAAGIGLWIEPKYIRKGKWLIGVRFNCRLISKDEPRPVHPVTETGKETDAIAKIFPDEFQKYFDEELQHIKAQPHFNIFNDYPEFQELAANSAAMERVKKAHPEFKTTHDRKAKSAGRADEIRAYKKTNPEAQVKDIAEKFGVSEITAKRLKLTRGGE